MERATLLLMCAMLSMTALACISQPKEYIPNDPMKLGLVPAEARLVAETKAASFPLLFVAPEDGQVFYFANDELLATIGVQKGQRIELNAMEGGSTETVISINEKPAFRTGARAGYNRLYFAPASKPILTSSDE